MQEVQCIDPDGGANGIDKGSLEKWLRSHVVVLSELGRCIASQTSGSSGLPSRTYGKKTDTDTKRDTDTDIKCSNLQTIAAKNYKSHVKGHGPGSPLGPNVWPCPWASGLRAMTITPLGSRRCMAPNLLEQKNLLRFFGGSSPSKLRQRNKEK